jgi:DNA-binding IclR family transcriptional regulator
MTSGEPTAVDAPDAVPGSSGLARDLELLRCLAHPAAQANGGLNVTQLAEATNRESSQVSRVMRALETANLVERDANRNYRIGPALFALAARSADNQLYRLGMITLETLTNRVQESVHLCTLIGTKVRTLATRTPDNFVSRVIGWEEQLVPAQSTSAGRVLLGDFTRPQLKSRFADVVFHDAGPRSPVHDIDSLWTEVQRAKVTGYAIVDEEFADDWVGASAAVRDHTGRIVAAINASAQKHHWPQGLAEMGRMTAAAATELSRSLGHLQAASAVQLRPV